jgi:hypothetical protein
MKFSDELEGWLEGEGPKSLGDLTHVFAEKTFAVAIMVLMGVSTAPVPTGGVLLTMQFIAILLAGEMVLGRRTIWIPARWRERELGPRWTRKTLPLLVRLVRALERHSRPRWSGLFDQRWFTRLLGGVLLILGIASVLAPPFTGLDKLPSIGAVIVALSIVVEDVLVLALGLLIGTGGVVLFVAVGAAAIRTVWGWL